MDKNLRYYVKIKGYKKFYFVHFDKKSLLWKVESDDYYERYFGEDKFEEKYSIKDHPEYFL